MLRCGSQGGITQNRTPARMLIYLSTARHDYTIRELFLGPGERFRPHVVPMDYDRALATVVDALPRATWVFTDFDRLDPDRSASAAILWQRLADRGDRLLNHPTRSMRRFELLRAMHAAGINAFDVWHLTDRRAPTRYPVFLRRADAHAGPLSQLLHDPDQLRRAIARLFADGVPRDQLIIVEYCDTRGADGLFRKYGVGRFGPDLMTFHLQIGTEWASKAGGRVRTDDVVAEEMAYIDASPHLEMARTLFDMARIDYGRIDFGLRDGRPQVWEINSNPTLYGMQRIGAGHSRREAGLLRMFDRLLAGPAG